MLKWPQHLQDVLKENIFQIVENILQTVPAPVSIMWNIGQRTRLMTSTIPLHVKVVIKWDVQKVDDQCLDVCVGLVVPPLRAYSWERYSPACSVRNVSVAISCRAKSPKPCLFDGPTHSVGNIGWLPARGTSFESVSYPLTSKEDAVTKISTSTLGDNGLFLTPFTTPGTWTDSYIIYYWTDSYIMTVSLFT